MTHARRQVEDSWDRVEASAASAPPPSTEPPAAAEPAVPDLVVQAYRRLEVPVGSDLATVKAGYRRVMKRYHPDRHSADPGKVRIATEVAAGLSEAYSRLEDHLGRSV